MFGRKKPEEKIKDDLTTLTEEELELKYAIQANQRQKKFVETLLKYERWYKQVVDELNEQRAAIVEVRKEFNILKDVLSKIYTAIKQGKGEKMDDDEIWPESTEEPEAVLPEDDTNPEE